MVSLKYQLCNFRPLEIRWWPQCSSKTKNSFLYTPEYICVRCWQKRSGEIGTTKNPSTKMSISLNSYASLSYWSCYSKCVLKKTASMVEWSMSFVTHWQKDPKISRWPRILASRWAHAILSLQAKVIGRIFSNVSYKRLHRWLHDHEHRDTISIRSDDIEMTKSPSIKMSTSYDIYSSYIY